MRDYEELCRAVYWEMFDANLNPEDVYDMAAMYADDEPGVHLHDLMHAHVRFPERDDENSASILREICMQKGVMVRTLSYDDIISDIVNIHHNTEYILSQVK